MRVAMVTPYYFPVIGGSENQVNGLSEKLNEIGIPTDIITFNFFVLDNFLKPLPFQRIERRNGLTIIKVAAFDPLPCSLLHHDKINFMINFIPRKLRSILTGYSIIHFQNETDLSFPLFSYTVKKPKIFHLRCLDVTYSIFKNNPICKGILKRVADIYIVQSKFVSKLLVNLGVPYDRIRVIPNGIDTTMFRPEKNKEKINNMLLFVGRITRSKGLHVLLTSLKYVNQPVQLNIIGPLRGNSDYNQTIFRLISKINERSRHKVVYLGPKKPKEILEYYQTSSIVIVPSLSESFGNVVLEALACETPVIASNVGGIPEIIKNYENGILVPPEDCVKLAEAIQFLLNDEDARRKLGKEGRRQTIERFSFESVVKKILDIYNELKCYYD